ncbi:MAG: hypothetical protein A2042_04005 [Candidatus Schekmanbacteria bacterium GWA2_38_11]|uniref:Radical SAM core domain-containing protein n=1 Tax=Candidatus Schekmanbacteria bacterium GWA2_38_11 TaxID=1817876 RepID=A0A1F7RPB0_9BACT|nr:MAG: hypothetical protein A2042_04005 [Candidatus Schekmanbacteria bacterium GWA2_38_11]
MTKRVAEKATFLYIDYIKNNILNEAKIRFFGGEPLLQWDLIKRIMERTEKESLKINFDLTTNGLLLDAEKIEFFGKHPEIELIISLDGGVSSQNLNRNFNRKINSFENIHRHKKELSMLPNITINMVIAPNQVHKFYQNFKHIYELGFRRLNFLPAYFVFWPKKNLAFLKKGFSEILSFIKNNKNISVKNMDVLSETPFFNQGIVIDCNGDIYHTNIFLSRHFEKLSDGLREGNILDSKLVVLPNRESNGTMKLIKNNIDPKLYYSTLRADSILSNFVLKLKNTYAKN